MFVAFYRWQVKPGREDEFCEAWARVTRATYRLHGSLGSRLHRSEDGSWIAYAQWPSRADWERAWNSGKPADPAALALMRECVEHASREERTSPLFSLTVVDDLLEAAPYSAKGPQPGL